MTIGAAFRIAATSAFRAARASALDAAGFAGGAMVAHGAAQVYHPLGWIVGGAELLAMVILIARAQRRIVPSTPTTAAE
jgi:hypothetical protein